MKRKNDRTKKRLSTSFSPVSAGDVPMESMGASTSASPLYSDNQKANPMYVEQ